MKIIIFNDTSIVESNPGCYHTFEQLRKNLQKDNPNSEIKTFPLLFGYDHFRNLAKKNWRTRNKIYQLYLSVYWQLKSIDFYHKYLKNKIKKGDKIVVNAEGTIHHNSVGALTLLGIIYVLGKKNHKVYVLNGTIEKINSIILKKSLKKCQAIIPREINSYNYLKKQRILNIKLGADCVFNLVEKEIKTKLKHSSPKILFTPGVLIPHGDINHHQQKINTIYFYFEESIKKYKDVTVLQIEEKENGFINYAKSKGCKTISINEYNKENILHLINKFDIVISARYHILIFGIILKKGIIPLDYTNTYKIDGLLKLLNVKPNNFSPIYVPEKAIKKCITLAKNQTA